MRELRRFQPLTTPGRDLFHFVNRPPSLWVALCVGFDDSCSTVRPCTTNGGGIAALQTYAIFYLPSRLTSHTKSVGCVVLRGFTVVTFPHG